MAGAGLRKWLTGVFILCWLCLQLSQLDRLEVCARRPATTPPPPYLVAALERSAPPYEAPPSASPLSRPLVPFPDSMHLGYSQSCANMTALPRLLCEAQSEAGFHQPGHLTAVVRDVSYGRYFSQRDLQGWSLSLSNISFEVVEHHARRSVPLDKFALLLCLALDLQDTLCLRQEAYLHLGGGQRINQFYQMRHVLWRKDSFCRTLQGALESFASPDPDFSLPCWVLPEDLDALRPLVDGQAEFVVKPSDRGEGHGIFVTSQLEDLMNDSLSHYVVQPLLVDPFLVEERKVDLRTYVLVTSVLPLRAYLFKEGLVRFASERYSGSNRTRTERTFLTNTSIGKKYTDLSNLTWTFVKLRVWLDAQGHSAGDVFRSVQEAIAKTLLAAEGQFAQEFAAGLDGYDCSACYQLLGVDVIFDSQLRPHVLEVRPHTDTGMDCVVMVTHQHVPCTQVNGLPSMQLSHDLGVPPDPTYVYTITKFELMHDLLQMVLSPTDVADSLAADLAHLQVGVAPGPLCDGQTHITCIDQKDLYKLVALRREYLNQGGFTLIYPHADGERFRPLVDHMHRLLQGRGVAARAARTSHHYHTLTTALLHIWAAQDPPTSTSNTHE